MDLESVIDMEYNKKFNPKLTETFEETIPTATSLGDRCNKSVYVYTDEIILAVNVAIVTGRPILVRGPSGWGKSSLARNVAKVMGWRYYEKVISSRTQARDLLYEVDLLHRLRDAQDRVLTNDFTPYINPGVLWWAFDPESARTRGTSHLGDSSMIPPIEPESGSDNSQAVVLLDEIDKADPDVPNNLLIPLGSLRFYVEETGFEVLNKKPPLIILTTNDERDLPPAFLRRCVELKLQRPDMLEIGKAHFGIERIDLLQKVASLFETESKKDTIQQSLPSPAEFIDTAQACIDLEIKPDSEIWEKLTKVTVWKHGRTTRK